MSSCMSSWHVELHVELACRVVMPCKAKSQGRVVMQSLVTSQVTIRVELLSLVVKTCRLLLIRVHSSLLPAPIIYKA
jgi:hypothetical protein